MKQKKITKFCKRCIMPDTYPGIKFNADGFCNFCMKGKKQIEQSGFPLPKPIKKWVYSLFGFLKKRDAKKFLCKKKAPQGKYDCIVGLSGGKDSAYVLLRLKNDYGMNVLACTEDKGDLPDVALKNIELITKKLNVDHIMVRHDRHNFRGFFNTLFKNAIHSKACLDFYVCKSCFTVKQQTLMKMAIAFDIPYVVICYNRAQDNQRISMMRRLFPRLTFAYINMKFKREFGKESSVGLISTSHLLRTLKMPKIVSPFPVWGYNLSEIMSRLKSAGFGKSNFYPVRTNCPFFKFMFRTNIKRFGFYIGNTAVKQFMLHAENESKKNILKRWNQVKVMLLGKLPKDAQDAIEFYDLHFLEKYL